MNYIRLRFVQGLGPVSSLISWFSDGHLSHVDALMPDGKLLGARSDVVGGGDGVLERPNPYEKVAKIVTYDIPATLIEESAFYAFLRAQLGKAYDHMAIFSFAIARNWRDDDEWYCSELQAAALEDAGILTKTLFLSVNKITPVMLATLVSDLPGVIRRDC